LKKGGIKVPRWAVIYKSVITLGGTIISYLYGEWTGMLTMLLAMVTLDYITGVFAALIEGKLCSSAGFKGIAKKVIIFALVAVAHLMDVALGGEAHLFRDGTIFFYISNELLSIIKNAARAGVPIPKRLRKAILILNDTQNKNHKQK
jgi:toxin secretion/phage lysis holin